MQDEGQQTASPSWSTTSWLMSLQLLDIIASELLLGKATSEAESDYVKALDQRSLRRAIRTAMPALEDCLVNGCDALQQQEHVDAASLNDKFSAAEGSFTFTYGHMDTYHAGLEGLIGLPNPDIDKMMEFEHRQTWYSTATFNCWYIPGGTSAKAEYDYVNGKVFECDCANGRRDAGHDGWDLNFFLDRNKDLIERSGLQKAEVRALRLYTGPMYIW
jgi:hypothetical protein